MRKIFGTIILVIGICDLGIASDFGFKAPVRLKAGDEYIDTENGHAAPFVGDFNGDGRPDLQVGPIWWW